MINTLLSTRGNGPIIIPMENIKHGLAPVKRDLKKTRSTGKLMVCHGNSHPFGEKCEFCIQIKKEYITMIKKALPTHKGGVLTRSEVKKILDNL